MTTRSMTNKNDRKARHPRASSAYSSNESPSYLARGNEQLREIVEDREGQTVLLACAVGFGIGVAIGYALGGPSERERGRWSDRITAEGLGRKLLDRIDQFLPEAVASRLHR